MIHEFQTLDSSQTKAKELIESNQASLGDVIWCREQTAGRGRGNHGWQAQAGASLTCTFIAPSIAAGQPPLSLIVGVLLAQQFNQSLNLKFSKFLQIKWPNDLYVENKKLGGILIENNSNYSLIGIGLNIKYTPVLERIDAIALENINHSSALDLNIEWSLHQVIEALPPLFNAFKECQWDNVWQQTYSYIQSNQLFLNQAVILDSGNNTIQGIIRGIDNQGALLLETNQGENSITQPIIQASNIRGL